MLARTPSAILPTMRRVTASPRTSSVSHSARAARCTRRTFATHVEDNFRIPIIDFSKYRDAATAAQKEETAQEVVRGFTDVGFIYLSNHGIPEETVKHTFQKSAEFFSMPIEKKAELAWRDPRANRGFVQVGRERVTQSANADEIRQLREKAPDYKESMEIGRDWDKTYKNYWPREVDAPGFKRSMLNFFQTCHELHVLVMRSIALGLRLEETFFDSKIHEQYHNLRLLSYPPIKTQLLRGEGTARAGAHSDYGTLTLLFQDSVGGLEVQNPRTGQFQPATPIPGTIVVNAGDLLARWSNDVLRSTLHRVVAPPAKAISETEGVTPARQSIAFFCNPNQGAEISCLPTCVVPGGNPKYPPVTTEDYIVGRLKATYM
ncbi:Clavaminate synthase-like protein [Polyporus arcularius HHB13444]|uniref:Clavaminate synthase-like protein n=1 Tax=Polyporus arcularius HHB13444 TaxID=1314778 RepID=A0A5C3PH69_9APHY|nr:Clavaminate synthase-like protein [Polyporus arcularius HHB13444]